MARPWRPRLSVFADLFKKRQVYQIAKSTGLDNFSVVGRLIVIWLEAQERAQDDGLMYNSGRVWVDAMAGHDGFADAMAAAGWLEFARDGVRIPNFGEFISKTAVRRIEDANRKAAGPAGGAGYIADCAEVPRNYPQNNPPAPPDPPPTHRQCRSKPAGDPLFDRFWAAYPRKVGKPAAVAAWKKLAVDEGLLGRMIAAVGRQARSDQWVKDNGQFIPHPSTWLNQRRWEDEDPGGAGGPVHPPGRVPPADGQYGRKRSYQPEEGGDVPTGGQGGLF